MIPRHVQVAVVLLLVAIFGAGFYALRLKRNAEEAARHPAETPPLAVAATGPAARIALWIAYDDDAAFRAREVSLPLPKAANERAAQIVRALFSEYARTPSPHPLPPGSDVNAVYIVHDLAVVDLAPALADQHRSGALLEEFTVTSIVATLAANMPEIRRVKFLVGGQERETLAGHADLVSVYDVSSVNQFVQGLQVARDEVPR